VAAAAGGAALTLASDAASRVLWRENHVDYWQGLRVDSNTRLHPDFVFPGRVMDMEKNE
jgi:hypothetical protein